MRAMECSNHCGPLYQRDGKWWCLNNYCENSYFWEHTKEWKTNAFLDVNDKHPGLFGDAILLRDYDGMGFALKLESLCGKFVQIIIRELPNPTKSLCPVEDGDRT